MNDRYGWDDRDDRARYRRQSGEGSHRYREDDGYNRGEHAGWRSEDQDWRSRSGPHRDRFRHRSDYVDGPRGGSTFGYGDGRVGGYGGSSGGYGYEREEPRQSYAGEEGRHRHYSSSAYGYGQPGAGSPPQPYFTGQQQSWEVPSPRGAPGSFGGSYGGSGGYGGGAGGYEGYGEDYRDHGYAGREHERGFLQRAGDEIASWFGDEDAARRREQDHRGRGPRDYVRSDERIREDANDRLTDDWRVDASGISVTVEKGEVTLDGTVTRRGDKRRAEDIVEGISGVKHVQNNLRVRQNEPWGAGDVGGETTDTATRRSGSTMTGARGGTSATASTASTIDATSSGAPQSRTKADTPPS